MHIRCLENRAHDTCLKINYKLNDETRHNILTLGIQGTLIGNNRVKNNMRAQEIFRHFFQSNFTERASFFEKV